MERSPDFVIPRSVIEFAAQNLYFLQFKNKYIFSFKFLEKWPTDFMRANKNLYAAQCV